MRSLASANPGRLATPSSYGLAALACLTHHLTRPAGRRGHYRLWTVLAPLLDHHPVVLRLADDAVFLIDLMDPDWNPLVSRSFVYEPEVEWVLRRLRNLSYVFIDAGANHGYWSVRVSSAEFGSKHAVAIEADNANFRRLLRNRQLNGDRFLAVEAALSDRTGAPATLHGTIHAGRHLRFGATGERGSTGIAVRTAALDDLLPAQPEAECGPVVLKLDVEGQEAQVLAGAARLLERDVLIVYEDHGRDVLHAVTGYIRAELGFRVGQLLDSGAIRPLEAGSDFDRIKTDRRRGYNFVAYRDGSAFVPFLLEPRCASAGPQMRRAAA